MELLNSFKVLLSLLVKRTFFFFSSHVNEVTQTPLEETVLSSDINGTVITSEAVLMELLQSSHLLRISVCVCAFTCVCKGGGGGLERRYQSIIDWLKWNKVQLDEIWPESPSTPPGCETLALGATDPDLMMTQHFTDVWISLRVKERQRQWHSVKCKTLSAFLSLSRLFEPPVVLWSGYRV